MSTADRLRAKGTLSRGHMRRRPRQGHITGARGQWWRFVLLLVITAIILVPIGVSFVLALRPNASSTTTSSFTLENFSYVLNTALTLTWLRNSLLVTLGTVVVSVAVAAPAGYVIARSRGRAASGYAFLLFVIQALPVIIAVIPLFIVFAAVGLVDSLIGIGIIYVASTMSVATWMMAAYFASIPIALEEAAWIDGCSVAAGFFRIVLRNSFPAVLSTAIFAFLLAWNDYLVALVFLKTNTAFTLPIGLQSFFQQNTTDWGSIMAVAVLTMVPPIIIFATLNKYFKLGGIGGALAGN